MAVANLRVMGRATQGVRLIKIDEGDSIAAVAKVDVEEAAETVDDVVSENYGNSEEAILDPQDDPIVNDKTDNTETEN
jgi:DNA gyrase subunit A